MFFNFEERGRIRKSILDETIVHNLFEGIRERIGQNYAQAVHAEKNNSAKVNSWYRIIANDHKHYANEMNFVSDMMEAMLLNAIEEHKMLSALTDAYLQKDHQRDQEVISLRKKIIKQEKEIQDIKKHKQSLEYLDKFFERQSRTSSE
jgi:hypothetical protein